MIEATNFDSSALLCSRYCPRLIAKPWWTQEAAHAVDNAAGDGQQSAAVGNGHVPRLERSWMRVLERAADEIRGEFQVLSSASRVASEHTVDEACIRSLRREARKSHVHFRLAVYIDARSTCHGTVGCRVGSVVHLFEVSVWRGELPTWLLQAPSTVNPLAFVLVRAASRSVRR